jgi:GT2 family glycosyltransferase
MKVGIVMPCINLWAKYTKPAIDSVAFAMGMAMAKHAPMSMQDLGFLLIDNASTDETQEEAKKIKNDAGPFSAAFEYHRNEERWGFQRSVNFGVKHFFDKGFDLVLVLNNDIVIHADAISRLIERFAKGGAGMVTCMDVRGECDGNPTNLQKISAKEKEPCPESPHPNFSAFMVNRECWEKVGEFDELFAPAYFEDNDFHYRTKLAGVAAVCYPPAMFLHYGSRTQNEALATPIVSGPEFENKRALFIKKWGGAPGAEVFTHPYDDASKPITSVKQTV